MINNENIKRLFPNLVLVFGVLIFMQGQTGTSKLASMLALIVGVAFWLFTNRKAIIAVKRKPSLIPLLVLAGAFVYYSLNLTTISNTTYNVNYPTMGLTGFAMMLLSALMLVCVLNAFPRRKKANIPMLVLTFVMIAVVIFSGVVYIDRIDDKLNNTYSAEYVDYLDKDGSAKKQLATIRQTVVDEMIAEEAPLSDYGFAFADQATMDAAKADAKTVQEKAEEYAKRRVYTDDGALSKAAGEAGFCEKHDIPEAYQGAETLRGLLTEAAAAKMPLGGYGFTTIDQQTLKAMKADAAEVLAKAKEYEKETVCTAAEAFAKAATEMDFFGKYGIAPEFQAAEKLEKMMKDVAAANMPLSAYGFTTVEQQTLEAMKADATDVLAQAKQYEKELAYTADEAFVKAAADVKFCEKYGVKLDEQSAEKLQTLMKDVAAAELPLGDYGFTSVNQQMLEEIKADAASVLEQVDAYTQEQIYTIDGAVMLPTRAAQFCEKYNVQLAFQTTEELQKLLNEALMAEMPLAAYGVSALDAQTLEDMKADAAAVQAAAKQLAKEKAYTADEALLQAAGDAQFCEKYGVQAEYQAAEMLRELLNKAKSAKMPLSAYGVTALDQQTLEAMKADAAQVQAKAEKYAKEKVCTADEALLKAAGEVEFCEKYGIQPEYQAAETLRNVVNEAAAAVMPLSAYDYVEVEYKTLQAMQIDAAAVLAKADQYAQELIYSADEALLIAANQADFFGTYGVKPEFQTAEELRKVLADVALLKAPTAAVERVCEYAQDKDSGVTSKLQQGAAAAADKALEQYKTDRPYVVEARKTLETHRTILLVGAALLLLLPLYTPLIRKIKTSVEIEANAEMGELDLEDAD